MSSYSKRYGKQQVIFGVIAGNVDESLIIQECKDIPDFDCFVDDIPRLARLQGKVIHQVMEEYDEHQTVFGVKVKATKNAEGKRGFFVTDAHRAKFDAAMAKLSREDRLTLFGDLRTRKPRLHDFDDYSQMDPRDAAGLMGWRW